MYSPRVQPPLSPHAPLRNSGPMPVCVADLEAVNRFILHLVGKTDMQYR